MLGGLERGKGFLNVFLEVLDEDSRFPFEQKIEPLFCPVNFKKAIDDQNDENDSGENRKVDRRETSGYPLSIPEQSASLPILPVVRFFWGPWALLGYDLASFAEKRETPAHGTRI